MENDYEKLSFEEKYKVFLDDCRENARELALNATIPEPVPEWQEYIPVSWTIVGVNFKAEEIEEKYGKDVYQAADTEVPYIYDENDKRNYDEELYLRTRRDYSKANVRLGYLINSGVNCSKLMDLDYLIKLLEEKEIPSYIDYDEQRFYYNETPKKDKSK